MAKKWSPSDLCDYQVFLIYYSLFLINVLFTPKSIFDVEKCMVPTYYQSNIWLYVLLSLRLIILLFFLLFTICRARR